MHKIFDFANNCLSRSSASFIQRCKSAIEITSYNNLHIGVLEKNVLDCCCHLGGKCCTENKNIYSNMEALF